MQDLISPRYYPLSNYAIERTEHTEASASTYFCYCDRRLETPQPAL